MERDIESKLFKSKDFANQKELDNAVKQYMDKLRKDYPFYLVTKEFVVNRDILVRMTRPDTRKVTQIRNKIKEQEKEEKQFYIEQKERDKQKEKELQRQRERIFARGRGGRSRTR